MSRKKRPSQNMTPASQTAQSLEPAAAAPETRESAPFDQTAPHTAEYKGFTSPMLHRLNLIIGFLFQLCYRVGVQAIRSSRRAGKALCAGTKKVIVISARAVWGVLYRVLRWIWRDIAKPFTVLIQALVKVFRDLRAGFREGKKSGLRTLGRSLLYLLGQLFRTVKYLLNYLAPAAAIYVLVVTINYFGNVDYALAVKYNGHSVGYVSNLDIYAEAEKMLGQRLAAITVYGEEDTSKRLGAATYSLVFVPDTRLSSSSTLCDRMIEKSTSDLVTASGVYVGGDYYGAVADGTELRSYLEEQLVVAELANQGAEKVKASFVKEVRVENGLYPAEGLRDTKYFLDMFQSEVSGEKTYTVKTGDTAYMLAWENNLSLKQFYEMNPWAEEVMYPGDEVVLAKSVPFLQIQIAKTVEYTEEVPYKIERVESAQYSAGYVGTVKQGIKGENRVVANVVTVDGIEVARDVLETEVLKEPVNEQLVVGTKPTGYASAPAGSAPSGGSSGSGMTTYSAPTGKFMWPVDGGYVSCRIWGYYGHTGMDIAGRYGTNIRAADSGIVEATYVTQYAWGYGRYILINHRNGYKTLYAHNSQIYVSTGDWVNKGDIIAAMGMTGNATGNHLHFEIRYNGSFLDPAAYIGLSYWR